MYSACTCLNNEICGRVSKSIRPTFSSALCGSCSQCHHFHIYRIDAPNFVKMREFCPEFLAHKIMQCMFSISSWKYYRALAGHANNNRLLFYHNWYSSYHFLIQCQPNLIGKCQMTTCSSILWRERVFQDWWKLSFLYPCSNCGAGWFMICDICSR